MASSAPQDAENKIAESEAIAALCDEIDVELAELKVQYEQFFLGVERKPPARAHEKLKKRVNELRSKQARQTAVKFRIGSIAQKLTSFERLWDRTLKEIENGTYQRDLFKAKLHDKRKKTAATTQKIAQADPDFHVEEDLDLSDMDGGGDDLASALEEAAASVRTPMPPVAPNIPALVMTPAGKVPAISPVQAPGLTPLTATPVIKPVTTGAQPALRPTITAAHPVFTPGSAAKAPTGSTGTQAAFTPGSAQKAPTGSTGTQAAFTPGSAQKAPTGSTGSQPAFSPSGVQKAPTGSTGSQPAFKPLITPQRPMGSTDPAPRPSAPPPAAGPPKKPAPPVAAEGGLSEQKIKAIYDAYVMAKRRCGEDVSKLSLNSVADTLKKQVPALMKQHNAKSVEFKVVIKEGKAVLRALPKDET